MPIPRCLALLAVLVLTIAQQTTAATITSIDREPLQGTVVGADVQKRLLVKVADSETPIGVQLDGLEEITFSDRPPSPESAESAPFKVTLTDGTILIGTILGTDNPDTFRIRSTCAGTVTLGIDALSRIELRKHAKSSNDLPPDAEELKDRVEEFKVYFATGGPGICDILEVTEKGARLFFPGITKDAASAPITEFEKIRSITRGATKSTEPTELFGIFNLEGGDVVKGVPHAWGPEKLTLRTSLGGSVEIKTKVLISATFKNGRFVYLSDLEPKNVEEHPYIRSPDFKPEDHLFSWRRDTAQGGGPLTIRGRRYAKGLGVHAMSSLTFRSDRRYTRFTATIGIDDSASALGTVVFKVLVDGVARDLKVTRTTDGKTETKNQSDSGTIRAVDGGLRIEVDIAGASEVTLIADAAGDSDVGDRANWANAKFIR